MRRNIDEKSAGTRSERNDFAMIAEARGAMSAMTKHGKSTSEKGRSACQYSPVALIDSEVPQSESAERLGT
jgi:thiamine pyrophosphate-dependent acetolactate synthase large subunit-like protein